MTDFNGQEREALLEELLRGAMDQKEMPDDGFDARVEAVLATVSGYHLGVLRLYHAPRDWPEAIRLAFGCSASHCSHAARPPSAVSTSSRRRFQFGDAPSPRPHALWQ